MTESAVPPVTHNQPEYSVSEISHALKRTVEEGYENIRVRGEISGFKRHSSGHLYFSLKDTGAVLDAVCWRGSAGRLAVPPEDGLEVVVQGRLTTYPGRSKYQMVVERMELAGQGALLKLLEDRRRRLAAEGLFDAARKRKLPFLPAVIGVVTSPTGAVIQDILHRLADRFPRRVLIWPVAVQGESAAAQVAAAIEGFNRITGEGAVPRPDLLIVARGGGSLEDLWAFNEEIVVRAAAASAIPLISAVGHETDTTLIDFASDLRAPTPTAAAELAVPVRRDLIAGLLETGQRLSGALLRLLEGRRLRLDATSRALPDLRRRLPELGQAVDDRGERLANALPNLLARRRAELERAAARLLHPREQIARRRHLVERLELRLASGIRARHQAEKARIERLRLGLAARADRLPGAMARLLADRRAALVRDTRLLDTLSYEQVLRRGFALVRDGEGKPVVTAEGANAGDRWTVTFQGGKDVPVAVTGPASGDSVAAPPTKPIAKKAAPVRRETQGKLF